MIIQFSDDGKNGTAYFVAEDDKDKDSLRRFAELLCKYPTLAREFFTMSRGGVDNLLLKSE